MHEWTHSVFLSLRKLGASEGTINQEIQRYQQLESVAVNDIRRDVRKKLRRSSMRVRAPSLAITVCSCVHTLSKQTTIINVSGCISEG